MNKLIIRKAAVLGAGVMGAQIAAHLVNCGIPVVLYDLPAREGDANGVVLKAIAELQKLQPQPLTRRELAAWIEPANYDAHLSRLAECDLIIEAIAERMDLKRELYARIAPYLRPDVVIATNTSGLSINAMSAELPPELRTRFCGVHFFNPPRYMRLVEIIPATATDPDLVDALEAFLICGLGKGVVRAFDSPNFVANRIGTFAMVAAMQHTERFGLGFDEVDALTGPLIGRPKSATYRLMDVIGLDTLGGVLRRLPEALSEDPWRGHLNVPAWLDLLIEKGAFGQKSGGGIYRKEGKDIHVLDGMSGSYRPAGGTVHPEVEAILKLADKAEQFRRLRASALPQARFLWAIQRDLFHYCAVHLGGIAASAREIDLAMRWGYGWQQGPFEIWQSTGWTEVAKGIAEDIAAGDTLAATPLPDWVFDGRDGVHDGAGSFSAAAGQSVPRSRLAVYDRQIFPERLLGEAEKPAGTTVFESPSVRLWHLDGCPDVAILTLGSKGGTLGPQVVEDLRASIRLAESDFCGLVLWRPDGPFSLGADLKALKPVADAADWAAIDAMVGSFQDVTRAIKYAQIPVVAAVRGMALGGGCELAMHAARVVAALEVQPGLVEAGVGLIPAGGGCKELALRASRQAERTVQNEPLPFLHKVFDTVFRGTMAKSALDAKANGLLADEDVVVVNADELLHVALVEARALAASGWRPPLPARDIQVAGRGGIATLEMTLVNMREGGMISPHDYRVGRALATALCGGDIEGGTRVDEEWLLAVERREFLELIKTEATRQRVAHTLETGKPLRN